MDYQTETKQEFFPEPATTLGVCYASGCRFYRDGVCSFKQLEIGKNGRCLNFEEMDEKRLRRYLEERGLQPAAIEEIIREAGKDAGTD